MSEASYGKLIDGYREQSTLSDAYRGFFPRFRDSSGHVSSGSFDNALGKATDSYMGGFGVVMGLLGGSILQQVLLLVALFFVGLYLYRRCMGRIVKKGAQVVVGAGLEAAGVKLGDHDNRQSAV